MFNIIRKAVDMSQSIMETVLKCSDTAVDATLGNGNDTLFLSRLLTEGKVFAFEIQNEPVKKFKEYIDAAEINNVVLINDGHENIDKYIYYGVKGIMFNLGYLPGGDESIVTRPDSTVIALEKGLGLLLPGGIITMVVYTGHEVGKEEAKSVSKLLHSLNPREYSVMEIKYINRKNAAPYLIVIEKNDRYHGHK